MNLETPVLFLIFNRLDTAVRVFEQIRKVKPQRLFVAADGPRRSVSDDVAKCADVRRVILEMIDWPCDVKTLFREENLGCGLAPPQAITWFFEQVDEGIILEDDCLPDVTFFSFCQELLKRYRGNEEIMHISGNNFQEGVRWGEASYYFSIYNHTWGWATWRRCWLLYDFAMTNYDPSQFDKTFKSWKLGKGEIKYWLHTFGNIQHRTTVWDYQWTYTIWKNRGLSILPNENLIKNIGFNQEATHTKNVTQNLLNMKTKSIHKIIHANKIEISYAADRLGFRNHFGKEPSIWRTIKDQLLKISLIKRMYSVMNINQ